MAKKYYVVRVGLKPGIYETWDECKSYVSGFSGAEYKSFKNLEEAQNYFNGIESIELVYPHIISNPKNKAEATAYVDGSYDDSKKVFSYGLIIFVNNEEFRFCEKYDTINLISMRNVAGEIIGAQKAMEYCIDNGIKTLDLFYDYEGIEKWCTGAWKANKEGTIAYKNFYNNIKKDLKVTFNKVVAHSGDKYNEIADKLAKSAIKT